MKALRQRDVKSDNLGLSLCSHMGIRTPPWRPCWGRSCLSHRQMLRNQPVQTVKKTDGRTRRSCGGGRSARSVLPGTKNTFYFLCSFKGRSHAIGQLLVMWTRREKAAFRVTTHAPSAAPGNRQRQERGRWSQNCCPSFAVFYEATTEGQQSDDGHFSSPQHKSVNYPASLVDLGYGLGMVH